MRGWIWNVQISCAGGDAYARESGELADMYGALLGMQRADIGYTKLSRGDDVLPEIGFEGDGGTGEARPRWPDPEHPQQLHIDVEVGDVVAAEALVVERGATRLHDAGTHLVLADPIGHPFCLYPAPARPGDRGRGRIVRVVFDCADPGSLAAFYEQLLGMRRVLDTPERVVIASDLDRLRVTDDAGRTFDATFDPAPMLAFQRAAFPAARWPDPAHPAQVHLDLGFEDASAAHDLMARLGAVRLAEGGMHSVWADPAAHPFCAPPPT